MELRQQLELVEVDYQNEGKKVLLIFLDREVGEILEVQFNTQAYDTDKKEFVDSPEKFAQVQEWSQTYFNVPYETLKTKIGVKKDVYVYDDFCSLWETEVLSKFSEDMVKEIGTGIIKEIYLDDAGIRFKFEYEDNIYGGKMSYGRYIESEKRYYANPKLKSKRLLEFREMFGVSINDKDKLIGMPIMFEVKLAFGKHVYPELKAFGKTQKKELLERLANDELAKSKFNEDDENFPF